MPVRVEVDEDGEDAAVASCVVYVPLEPRALTCTQHTSAYVSIRLHTSADVSIRQQTSAVVSIRQHTSAYVGISGVDVALEARGLRA
jgi:hypothetical protein